MVTLFSPFPIKHLQRFLLYVLCYIFVIPQAKSQENWAPLHLNIPTENHNLSISNLDIKQDQNGLMFVGNLSGLLVYDESYNSVLKIANGSLVNSLYIGPQNQIYFASNNNFGFINSDKQGNLGYELIGRDLNGRIKSITSVNDSVIILSKDQLFVFYQDSLSKANASSSGFQMIFTYHNKLWVKEVQKQLQKLRGKRLAPLIEDTITTDKILGVQYESNNQSFFYSYPDYEFYKLDSLEVVTKIPNPHKKAMQLAISYKAINTGNSVAISTRKNGLMLVYPDSTSRFFNRQKGLVSDIVAGLTIDSQGAVWVALQNGLSRIETDNSWSNWTRENGLKDFINNVIRFDNKIYVSTMEGVHYMENSVWNEVSGLSNRAFSFLKTDDQLFVCASEGGLFSVKDSIASRITDLGNIWAIDQYDESRLLVPTESSGLYQVSFSELKYNKKLLNPELKGTPSSIYIANKDSTWLSMKWEGIYLIKTQADTAILKKFDKQYGLPDINESEIIKVSNKILITSESGFFEINKQPNRDSSDLFIASTLLPTREPVLKSAVDKHQNIWYSTYNQYNEQVLKKMVRQKDGSYLDQSIPLRRLPNQVINHIYVDPEIDGVIWIAGTKGLFRYNENIKTKSDLPFNTLIKKVTSNDSTLFNGFFSRPNQYGAPSLVIDQPNAYQPTLAYKNNDIKFEFSTTAYALPEKNTYSYYLEGLEGNWSKWTRNKQKEYSNLSPGTYTFHIKGRNLFEFEGRATSYTFTITPPWYLTNWAKAFFTLLGVTLIWFIILLYSYRLRMHRKHLKLLVADRTFEVMSQKKEIEKQYKQLSEQTEEMLLQSEQIELKNLDLEKQQEEILSINNQLEEMNTYLEKKVEKRTAKIKSTLDKLKQTNKELDTFIYKASHDLKGPLSRILGLSSLAKIETPTDKNIQYIEMIESTSRDMDLLLSKLTQVHEIFNQKPKIVPLLIEEILEDVKVKLNFLTQKGQINILLDNQINEPIKADHQLFYTVIFNLVENALLFKNHHLDEMHLINITLEKVQENIIIQVKDNGIGIEEDLIEAIFDMFYRASDQSKGSGLGLYLVKIAVEKMYGKITVESSIGKGTTFTIQLPF